MERMDEFFARRVEGYDEHMLDTVEGCRAGYEKMADALPPKLKTLLDLGCGTGLELEPIFGRFPDARVMGIDMTREMLDALQKKFPRKTMSLVCGDYFAVSLGTSCFDAAVSFQTMHHFAPESKLGLYKRIRKALRAGGVYAECDYMAATKAEEEYFFAENARLRREQNVPEGAFMHFDTPCAVDTQIGLLREAGFSSVENIFREGNTTLLVAKA